MPRVRDLRRDLGRAQVAQQPEPPRLQNAQPAGSPPATRRTATTRPPRRAPASPPSRPPPATRPQHVLGGSWRRRRRAVGGASGDAPAQSAHSCAASAGACWSARARRRRACRRGGSRGTARARARRRGRAAPTRRRRTRRPSARAGAAARRRRPARARRARLRPAWSAAQRARRACLRVVRRQCGVAQRCEQQEHGGPHGACEREETSVLLHGCDFARREAATRDGVARLRRAPADLAAVCRGVSACKLGFIYTHRASTHASRTQTAYVSRRRAVGSCGHTKSRWRRGKGG